MIKHDEQYYKLRKPVPDLGIIANFKRFLWDPERKALLGRTAQEWGKVGLFYLFFFGGLFFVAWLQLWITYKYVTTFDKPLIQYSKVTTRAWLEPNLRSVFEMSSLNVHGPGIVLKPNIVPNAEPALIIIDESHLFGHPYQYISAIRNMLSEYNVDKSKYDEDCKENVLHQNKSKPCYFDIQSLGKCSQPPYGYSWPAQPCVYLKFNKRFGWQPVFYNHDFYFPEKMPEWLKDTIHKSDKFHVWLSCEGVNENDDKLMGEIEYLPRPGFPVQYFPFNGEDNYQSPIVALRFKNMTDSEMVHVECKTWARNIYNENRYNLNFRILIKNPNLKIKNNP